MRRTWGQKGEGQAGCIFGVIIFLIAVFIAYKIIPVKVRTAELRQVVIDEGKSAGQHNDARIMKAILEKAEEEGLPVTEEEVSIVRRGNLITIDVEYYVEVNFPGKTWYWHQHHHAENPIF